MDSHRATTDATLPTHPTPQPTPCASDTSHSTQNSHATVHRTDLPDIRGTQADPNHALHLCPNVIPTAIRDAKRKNWEPHVLFPELATPISQSAPQALIADGSNPKKNPNPTPQAPPQQPRRTARLRTTKNAQKGPASVSVDAEDFLDIPLQYAEGKDILTLIGAPQVAIPPHLTAPQPPLPPSKEMGQSSKANPTNTRAQRPSAQSAQPARDRPTKQKGRRAKPPLPPSGLKRARSTQLTGHQIAPQPTQPQNAQTQNIRQAQQPLPPSGLSSTTNPHDAQADTSDTLTDPTSLHDAPDFAHAVDLGLDNEDDPYLDTVDYSGEEDLSV